MRAAEKMYFIEITSDERETFCAAGFLRGLEGLKAIPPIYRRTECGIEKAPKNQEDLFIEKCAWFTAWGAIYANAITRHETHVEIDLRKLKGIKA